MKALIRLFVRPTHDLFRLLAFLILSGLLVTCKEKSPKPLELKASFKLENDKCTAPCDPGVTNLSQNALTYRWDFGDGTNSTEENPKHIYTKGGSYPIKLTVTGEAAQTADTTLTVTIVSPTPVAAFTVQNDNCTVACEITFTNQSQNALKYQWEFGDGGTSTEAAPKHKYTKAGSFTVKLTVTGEPGKTTTATKTVTIKDTPLPVAAFTVQNDNCTVACEITFTNQSQNALSYQWDFGDGGTSTEAAPKHKYNKAGSFAIKLTVAGQQGRTATTTKTVTIKSQPVPVADFVIQNNNCIAPCTVVLLNKSQNATSYSWTITTGYTPDRKFLTGFGPITRNTTQTNPSQTYSNAAPRSIISVGTTGNVNGARLPYTVNLTATGPGGTHTVSKNITIRPPFPKADFNYKSIGRSEIQFTSQATNATSYLWDFGFGGPTSTAQNPKIGVATGTYTATLKVTNETGTATVKKAYFVPQPVN